MTLSVFTFSIRDRLTGIVLGAAAIALMLWFSLAIYSDLDLSFYYELPPALLDSMGISPEAGGVNGIAYGAMYNLMGALTLGGLAIAIGSAAIAGEEQAGTLGLLLGNPRSRSRVLSAKVAALVALTTLGTLLLWLAGVGIPALMGLDITGLQVDALVLHLGANALLFGMLALALGAWTGQPSISSGGAAALMVLSWLAVSVLPMIEVGETIVKAFPWYYFTGSVPEVNGVDGVHLAIQLGLCALLAATAYLGLNRRDLRSGGSAVTLFDRLRDNPRTAALAERVGGQARVSSITAKTVSDHQGMTLVVGAIVFYLGVLMPVFYTLLPDGTSEFFADLPDSLVAMIGGVDMSTATGYLQGEVFAISVPIAMIVLTATIGARALAGEEESRTMGLLLANAVPRRRVVLDKVVAMAALSAVVGVITFVAVTIGVLLVSLDVSVLNLAVTCLLATLLGMVFGALALLVSAATGRVRWAVGAAAGAALVGYVLQSFLPLSQQYDEWVRLSPFHYYLGSDPLVNGMPWGHAAVLLAVLMVLVGLALPLFDRRDLRG
jgi:ABC-2 type transport system permease protein